MSEEDAAILESEVWKTPYFFLAECFSIVLERTLMAPLDVSNTSVILSEETSRVDVSDSLSLEDKSRSCVLMEFTDNARAFMLSDW